MRGKMRLAALGGALIVLAVAAGVSTWLLRGGGGELSQTGSAGQIRWTIGDARQFEEFTLYWLGESFQGLPLTEIVRHRYQPGPGTRPGMLGENIVLFVYGDCTPSGGDGGCPVPLAVRVEPYCSRPPEMLARAVKEGPPLDIRGALGQQVGTDILLWTGDAKVSVLAPGNLALTTTAADALRGVAPGGPQAGEPLSPPDGSSC